MGLVVSVAKPFGHVRLGILPCGFALVRFGDIPANGIPEDDQTKIWDLVDAWSESAGETNKAALRERNSCR